MASASVTPPSPPARLDAVIIGGGVSGLTAASKLHEGGASFPKLRVTDDGHRRVVASAPFEADEVLLRAPEPCGNLDSSTRVERVPEACVSRDSSTRVERVP